MILPLQIGETAQIMEYWAEPSELASLMEHREIDELSGMGGIEGVYRKLHSSSHGLDKDTLQTELRQQRFSLLNYISLSHLFLSVLFHVFLYTVMEGMKWRIQNPSHF